MSALIGTRLGAYEITDAIGAGGMGEVYRARDSRLNRDVALKVLPEAFARDADRLARFKREAQVLASLNHPNIAAIYGLEELGEVRALVLELVAGPTLADVIARGPIGLPDALTLARQIADALEAAHDRGIIHRDLKPANVKLRSDGTVKVLDFGLATVHASAKAGALADGTALPDGEGPGFSRAITSPVMTVDGMVLGTAAYMSPEQAKGRPADKRSDVWAFGCVLFEMLTAKRPFDGEDVADTLAFVLTREPQWSALPAQTPAAIHTLLRRCLQKDRKKRLADIADARLELDDTGGSAIESIGTTAVTARTKSRALSAAFIVAGVSLAIALGAVALAVYQRSQSPPPRGAIRFDIEPPENTAGATAMNTLSVSRDGHHVAFVTGANRAEYKIWIRSLDSSSARLLPGTDQALDPIWSPDGRYVAFAAGLPPRLRVVDLAGGPPITLANAGAPGAWSSSGTIVFRGEGRRLYAIPERGGEAVPVTTLDAAQEEASHTARFFLPDGRRFAFLAHNTDSSKTVLYLASLDSPSRTKLLDDAMGASYADGHLVFQRQRTVLVQPFDADAGRLTGASTPVLENVAFDSNRGFAGFTVSANGVLAYRTGASVPARGLVWMARDGKPSSSVVLDGVNAQRRPSLSPDGNSLALTRESVGGERDVWVLDLERNVPTRITFDGVSSNPLWTPDGKQLAYLSTRNGSSVVVLREMSSNAERILLRPSSTAGPSTWSPDGRVLLVDYSEKGMPGVWGVRVDDGKMFPLVNTGFAAGYATFSPDGRWFAYCEGDSGPDQVYAQPFPPNGTRVRISTTSGAAPQWSPDGKITYTTIDDQLMSVDVTVAGNTLRPGTPTPLFRAVGSFNHRSVLNDARRSRFLLRDVLEAATRPGIHVVVNWLDELRATGRSGRSGS